LDEITHSFGFAQRLGRQPKAERALDAQDEFGPAQAIYSKIAFDPARRHNVDEAVALWMQLAHQFRDDGNKLLLATCRPGNCGRGLTILKVIRHRCRKNSSSASIDVDVDQ
jgi:hypothetical protein